MQLPALFRRQLADGLAEQRRLGARLVGFRLHDAVERRVELRLVERLGRCSASRTAARASRMPLRSASMLGCASANFWRIMSERSRGSVRAKPSSAVPFEPLPVRAVPKRAKHNVARHGADDQHVERQRAISAQRSVRGDEPRRLSRVAS